MIRSLDTARWVTFSALGLAGAIWATLEHRSSASPWEFVLVWGPLLAVLGAGFYCRGRFSELGRPPARFDEWTGYAALGLLFAGIDAFVVYGGSIWRPLSFAIGAVLLFIGFTTDWSPIAASPRWWRPLRQTVYFGMLLAAMAVAFRGDPTIILSAGVLIQFVTPRPSEIQRRDRALAPVRDAALGQ